MKISISIVDSIMTAPSEWFGEASDMYVEEDSEAYGPSEDSEFGRVCGVERS